ncbi:MFS transporter [Sphingosinithalassobacter sp. LHW66-3]|uniref:MFS transporter n=1 Tax=Sphingosinithalassobacter sp. LHW66-3 TaxID=3424718 RepID=UPI003D6C189C
MIAAVLPVRALLVAILMLMAGGGFLATELSIRLETGGSRALMIGAVGMSYFAGLTAGSLLIARLIERVGHIRTFAAVASLFAATTLAFALLPGGLAWMPLRFINGFCAAGVFICLESWLNERAEPSSRGSMLAGYMIALYSGQAIGQMLLTLDLGAEAPALPFALAAMLITLAAVPVALTRMPAPTLTKARPLPISALYAVSPLGVVGTVATGLMFGSFYALGAVYVLRQGADIAQAAWFMTAVILGGVALQWPLGKLSDRFDRRKVIVALYGSTVLTSLALGFGGGIEGLLLPLGAAFGGLGFALYPMCVAHTNDHLQPEQRVSASGGLVLLYSMGAAVGPFAAGGAIQLLGPEGLFGFIALCAAGTSGFGVWRQWHAAPVPAEDQQRFRMLPRTTPMVATLDRAGDEERAA